MLKLQYFGHQMGSAVSLEKALTLEKIEGRKRRGQQKRRWLNGFIDSKDMSLGKLQETVKDQEAWHVAVQGVTKTQTRLNDKTRQNLWDAAKAVPRWKYIALMHL